MTKRILHRCNSVGAVAHAMNKYDGAEIDVRRLGTRLVLAHDANEVEAGPYLTAVLRFVAAEHPTKTLAINVKEHGLANMLAENLSFISGLDYFVFDVPGVELPRYHGLGVRTFGRISYCEIQRPMPGGGVLVDPFRESDQLYLLETLRMSPAAGLPVAMISNGCHARSDETNKTVGVDYLIGKDFELDDLDEGDTP